MVAVLDKAVFESDAGTIFSWSDGFWSAERGRAHLCVSGSSVCARRFVDRDLVAALVSVRDAALVARTRARAFLVPIFRPGTGE